MGVEVLPAPVSPATNSAIVGNQAHEVVLVAMTLCNEVVCLMVIVEMASTVYVAESGWWNILTEWATAATDEVRDHVESSGQ